MREVEWKGVKEREDENDGRKDKGRKGTQGETKRNIHRERKGEI